MTALMAPPAPSGTTTPILSLPILVQACGAPVVDEEPPAGEEVPPGEVAVADAGPDEDDPGAPPVEKPPAPVPAPVASVLAAPLLPAAPPLPDVP
jgi:hypothetical protein